MQCDQHNIIINDLFEKHRKNAETLSTLSTEIVGMTGQNGLRGEVRSLRAEMVKMETDLNRKLDKIGATVKWLAGLAIASPAAVVAAINLLERVVK